MKNLLYLLILAILGTGVYFLIFKEKSNPFGAKEAGFTIKDTSQVGKIFIALHSGEHVTVERKSGYWMVNNEYKALPSTVRMVLYTLQSQIAVCPSTKAAYNNVVKELSTDGIKVEVYDLKGEKMSTFYVGGSTTSNDGTYMLMDGASQPYIVQTPGFVGDLRPRYTVAKKDWRDRTVFDIPAEKLKSVSVSYVTNPINSFVLERTNNGYDVKGDPSVTKNLDTLNRGRIQRYITFFSNVNCEGYVNGYEDVDSTFKMTKKRADLDIETVDNQKYHVGIFWMPLNKRSKNRIMANEDAPDDYDADRMYAVYNENKDTAMIQMLMFEKLLRRAYEFYTPDEAGKTPERAKNALINKNGH